MKKLPYLARTRTGETFHIEFPLHPETGDAVRVGQLVSLLLETIDRDIAIAGEASNGDVLQAIAMALSIRARMIHASRETTRCLSVRLLETAHEAVADAPRQSGQFGHA